MAIDVAHHRLFSGCRSGVLAVSDTQAGRVLTVVPIGSGVDGAGYDPQAADVFASNADGTLTVIHQDNPDTYRVTQSVATPTGSRNMGLDPSTHRLFVAAGEFAPPASGTGRPSVVSGSFKLLVIEKNQQPARP
jgi:DNA-binding beta-propeller fold protein YncE